MDSEGDGSVNVFPDQVLKRLEALARVGEAISTDQAREVLALTVQQFHRMVLQDDFPRREHIGLRWWLSPQALQVFAQHWNRLAVALTITDVARLIRSTLPTTRRASRQRDFPKPLGQINGRDRWERAAILDWQRERIGGAKLPPGANGGPEGDAPKKSKAKGRGNGKTQKEKRTQA